MAKCENCGKRSTRHTDDDVPVCQKCFEGMMRDDGICFACGRQHPEPMDFDPSKHPGALSLLAAFRCIRAIGASE